MTREKANPAPARVRDSTLTKSDVKVGIEACSSLPMDAGKSVRTSRRINPDSIQTLWFTVGIVGILAATSFMVSFAGLTEVAKWVGVPSWMSWTVPAFIDLSIIAYSLAVLVHRSRGETTWASWLSLGLFTGVSVIANAAHALSFPHENSWQAWIGAGIAALAPVGVFAATEELGRLAVEQPAAAQRGVTDLGEAQQIRETGHYPVAPAVEPTPEAAPAALLTKAEPVAAPDPEDDPDDPTPTPMPTKPEPEHDHVDAANESTPLFEQAMQNNTEASAPAPEPAPVALNVTLPKLAVVPAATPAAKGNVTDMDKLTRFVNAELQAGNGIPSTADVEKYLEVSNRTARRRMADFKTCRPELFNVADRKRA